ncbi:hypothetical protein MTO96_033772 [Rhipicephalus appendiculatus]
MPTSKRFNAVSESEDDRICEQDAALERDEESGENHAKDKQQQVQPGDCFLFKDGPVVEEIMGDQFRGAILPHARDFFKVPLKSSQLDIWRCDTSRNGTKVWPLEQLQNAAQCLSLRYKRGHAVVPLLYA